MKYDYQVKDIYGNEVTCSTLLEAKVAGYKMLKYRKDCDPIIDQYYKDDELTGDYWVLRNGKFVKPASLKELLS